MLNARAYTLFVSIQIRCRGAAPSKPIPLMPALGRGSLAVRTLGSRSQYSSHSGRLIPSPSDLPGALRLAKQSGLCASNPAGAEGLIGQLMGHVSSIVLSWSTGEDREIREAGGELV
jgi:hypothetical protein